MSTADFDVDDYLRTAKNSLENICACVYVTVVMGNVSCDLDSVGSSLAYGLYFYNLYKREKMNCVAVTLLDVYPEEFELKTEVLYWMKKLKIPTNNFIFRDQLDLKKLHEKGKLRLILVDHHVLAPHWSGLESSVIEVIDHRPIQKGVSWPNAETNITVTGSCASLIAEKLIQKREEMFILEVALLLYGPIILDTAGVSPTSGRTTDLDVSIAEKLEAMYDDCDRVSVLQQLVDARSDITHLPSKLVFLKDMKYALGLPICGFPVAIPKLLERNDFSDALRDFCEVRNVPLIILMGQEVLSGAFKRDFGIYSLSDPLSVLKLVEYLQASKDPDLQLKEVEEHSAKIAGLHVYAQGNSAASRKQILPLVQEAISNVAELQKFSEPPASS